MSNLGLVLDTNDLARLPVEHYDNLSPDIRTLMSLGSWGQVLNYQFSLNQSHL